FFFQAEDGIRDRNVTGVQTCALPIYTHKSRLQATLLSMGNSQQVVATGWHKAGILGGWIATFLLAAWILIPRLVIGTEVPIAMAMTVFLPIVVVAIGTSALGIPTSRGQSPRKRTVVW